MRPTQVITVNNHRLTTRFLNQLTDIFEYEIEQSHTEDEIVPDTMLEQHIRKTREAKTLLESYIDILIPLYVDVSNIPLHEHINTVRDIRGILQNPRKDIYLQFGQSLSAIARLMNTTHQ